MKLSLAGAGRAPHWLSMDQTLLLWRLYSIFLLFPVCGRLLLRNPENLHRLPRNILFVRVGFWPSYISLFWILKIILNHHFSSAGYIHLIFRVELSYPYCHFQNFFHSWSRFGMLIAPLYSEAIRWGTGFIKSHDTIKLPSASGCCVSDLIQCICKEPKRRGWFCHWNPCGTARTNSKGAG